jgi:glycosyltransferase involved in cell wall biosynthesis
MKTIDTTTWETAQISHPSIPGLVSVIICCRNGENYLREAIESILAQTYTNFEFLLIDNDSDDSTPAIAAAYPQIRYICHENQGLVRSRNRAIREARGEYIVFLDHDDHLLPNALTAGIHCFAEHQDCGFVFGRGSVILADGSLDHYTSFSEGKRFCQAYDYRVLLMGIHFISPLSAVMFRRDVLIALQGFDPHVGIPDDDEIYLRIARQYPIYYHQTLIAEYRHHTGSQMHSKMPQIRRDVRRMLKQQKPYVKGDRVLSKALRQGKMNWEYMYTISSLFTITTQIKERKWQAAWSLISSTIQLTMPHLPRLMIAFFLYLYFTLDRHKFERSQPQLKTTAEFIRWLEETQENPDKQTKELQRV